MSSISKPRRQQATTTPKQFAKQRFAWLDAIKAARQRPASVFLVAYDLGQRFNRLEGGRAWPGIRTIAESVGLSNPVVIHAIRWLKDHGFLEVEPGRQGRGHSNAYTMILKGRPADLFVTPEKVGKKGRKVDGKGRPAEQNSSTTSGEAKASPRGREIDVCASTPTAPAAAEAAGAEIVQASKQEIIEPSGVFLPKDYGFAVWSELRSLWARPWCDDQQADRRAFAVACQEAAPEVIIAAARAWVEAADAPRFLPKLAHWLADRAWEKLPPKRRQQRQHGYGKPDMLAVTLSRSGRSIEDIGADPSSPFWMGGTR
jgi:hypothetical protein